MNVLLSLFSSNWRSGLSVLGSAAFGGFLGYMTQASPAAFMSWASMKPVLIGAAGAALVAVVHLFQAVPQAAAPVAPGANGVAQ
jgi:hypothetical protein